MNYLYLIKALFIYDNYKKYRHHIKLTKENDKELYYLFKTLDSLIDDVQRSVTLEEFSLWVSLNLGNDYNPFLNAIKNQQEINEDLTIKSLELIKKRSIALEIAKTALSISEGQDQDSNLQTLFDNYNTTTIEKESPFIEFNYQALYEKTVKQPGLRWRLNSLNRSLGSLRKGDFGFIFARPETGKTTFLASEVSNFSKQVATPGIWFNNEESGDKVALRLYSSVLGLSDRELRKLNPNQIEEEFKQQSHYNILLRDSASLSKKEIELLSEEIKPTFIVVDQLDKIKGFTDDRDDLKLGKIYQWARELAKEYCPVIGVSQADASAEGKKYLTMDNVANAKTAKQAEADWIIGLGASHDSGFELIRHINIPKNKLYGDEDSDPKLRHGKFDILIQPELGRYKDL